MILQELLKYASENDEVVVYANEKLKFATSNKGIVTGFRVQGCKGCAVMFEGTNWSTWFHAIHDTDKRSKYMSSLSFENKNIL